MTISPSVFLVWFAFTVSVMQAAKTSGYRRWVFLYCQRNSKVEINMHEE